MNELKEIAETLRDLLRTKINGQSGYNFRLAEDQVLECLKHYAEATKFPYIMMDSVVERDCEQIALASKNKTKTQKVDVEIILVGMVHDVDDPRGEILKLQSDMDAAIRSDFCLSKNGQEIVYAPRLSSSCKEAGEFGLCEMKYTARYHKTS